VLKPYVIRCLIRLMSLKMSKLDLDLVDDEEFSCDTLQRMAIGDVRPQDPSNQPQETSPNDTY
jgi:hypothetical protein